MKELIFRVCSQAGKKSEEQLRAHPYLREEGMKRITLFVNGSPRNGKVVAVYGMLSDLLIASSNLGIKATNVYNGRGGLIDDIALIR